MSRQLLIAEVGQGTPQPIPAGAAVPAEVTPLLHPPTDDDQLTAREKAQFVLAVWTVATGSPRVPARDAAALVASRIRDWPRLQTGGKNGASLLQGDRAYTNYRAWLAKLGRAQDKSPAVDNWAALCPRYAEAHTYQRPGPDAFWTLLANLYENENRLSLDYAYRLATRTWRCNRHPCEAQAEGDARSRDDLPTIHQVRHYYARHADPHRIHIARHGADDYRNRLADYIQRTPPKPGEVWVGDHRIFDAAVRVWDPDRAAWVPVRPWITAWLDWGSRLFIGWEIRTISPNRDSIERALRHALAATGNRPPRHLYIDNGKDYRAVTLAGGRAPLRSPSGAAATGEAGPALRSPSGPAATGEGGPAATSVGGALTDRDCARVHSIAELLGIQVHFATPYNSRAKVIERQFRVVKEQFDRLWKSYRGGTPAERPTSADHAWRHPEQLPDLPQFIAGFQAWLHDIYHATPSQARGLDGRSPRAAWDAHIPATVLLDDRRIHRAFLRDLGERQVQRGGVVQVLRRRYRADILLPLVGRGDRVRVKVDPDDIDTAYLYDLKGRELGTARTAPELPAFIDPSDTTTVEQLRAEIARERRQIKAAKAAAAEARDLTRFTSHAPNQAPRLFVLPDSRPANPPCEAPAAGAARSRAAPSSTPSFDPSLLDDLDAIEAEESAAARAPDFDPDLLNDLDDL